MALKTQGFALSTLPRAPIIPPNVGAVDVKEIYDGVRQGLASLEQMRRAPSSMALADAETAAKTEAAPLQTAILAEQAKQAPMHTNILAADASPEMLDAKRKALLARTVKPLTGTPYLLRRMDELRAAQLANPDDPAIGSAIIETTQLLNKASAVAPNDPTAALTTKENIAAGNNTTKQAIATGANATKEKVAGINADGAPKSGTAAVLHLLLKNGIELEDPVIQGLLNKQSAEMASNPDADRASREKIADAANKTRMDSARAAREIKLGQIDQKNREKIAKSLGALESFEDNAKHIEDLIDRAISMTDNTSAGIGSIVNGVPLTKARALRGVLDSIRANMGFDYLTQMRANSPTGGALGQVSDTENKLTQATSEALDQGVDPDTLKERLANIRELRKQVLLERHRDYDRTVAALINRDALSGQTANPSTAQATVPSFNTPEEADAAGQAGTLKPGQSITVGGRPAKWNP